MTSSSHYEMHSNKNWKSNATLSNIRLIKQRERPSQDAQQKQSYFKAEHCNNAIIVLRIKEERMKEHTRKGRIFLSYFSQKCLLLPVAVIILTTTTYKIIVCRKKFEIRKLLRNFTLVMPFNARNLSQIQIFFQTYLIPQHMQWINAFWITRSVHIMYITICFLTIRHSDFCSRRVYRTVSLSIYYTDYNYI